MLHTPGVQATAEESQAGKTANLPEGIFQRELQAKLPDLCPERVYLGQETNLPSSLGDTISSFKSYFLCHGATLSY